MLRALACWVTLGVAGGLVGCGGDDFRPDPTGGTGGSGATGTGTAGEPSGPCDPGTQSACYDGPAATDGVGPCVQGQKTCTADGTWGACEGQVLPAEDSCATDADEDCDGTANGDCVCTPGEEEACYSGPEGTQGVGICLGSAHACSDDGLSWGACAGEVIPATEDCTNPDDEDCSGLACSEPLWSMLAGDASKQWTGGVATDAAGNVYVTGGFQGNVGLGGGTLTSAGGTDVFLAKLDASGNYVWSKSFGSANEQWGDDVAVTDSGEVVVVGNFYPSINLGGSTHNADLVNSYQSTFVARFDSAGTYISSTDIDVTDTYPARVAVDASGNAVVAVPWANLGANLLTVRVIKYAPNASPLWDKIFSGPTSQQVLDVAVDPMGHVLLIGDFQGSIGFGSGTLTSAGGRDVFVAKLDGSSGAQLWAQRFGDVSNQYAASIAADAAGNVVVHGDFAGSIDFGNGAMTATGSYDTFVAQLSSGGVASWSKRFAGSISEAAVATDGDGNVLVTGSFTGSVNLGGADLVDAGAYDIYLLKLDAAGAHLWSKRFGDSLAQHPYAVAADDTGSVLVVGSAQGSVDFGNGPLGSAGGGDVFIAKFAP